VDTRSTEPRRALPGPGKPPVHTNDHRRQNGDSRSQANFCVAGAPRFQKKKEKKKKKGKLLEGFKDTDDRSGGLLIRLPFPLARTCQTSRYSKARATFIGTTLRPFSYVLI
jgi:hypothetical protein